MISEQTRNKLTTIAENEQKVYDNGVADGKRAEYDMFWDEITDSGTRNNLDYAFRYWSTPYIRPTRKISVTQKSICVFSRNKKLKKIEGKYFDFSGWTPSPSVGTQGHYETFSYCDELEEIEDIGMRAGGYYDAYRNCPKLHTISVMRVTEDCAITNNNFHACYSLTNLIIDGTLGTNFNVQWCPLSVASLKSIIKHLKDYSGTDKEFANTVTFKSSAFNQLGTNFDNDDYEWFESTFNMSRDTVINANLSWRDMIAGLCWNLAMM